MEYSKWEPFYKQIVEDFEYDEEEDFNAGKVLDGLLEKVDTKANFDSVFNLINGQDVYIFGGGPSLKKDIQRIFKRNDLDFELPPEEAEGRPEPKTPKELGFDQIFVAADIATSGLMDMGIVPDVIVSDLDGIVEDLIEANKIGAKMIVHAHGDNQDKLNEFVPKFEGELVGTMQAEPSAFEKVVNVGGFTDGDRAVYLADHLNAKNILLIAFNFRSPSRKKGEPEPEEEDEEMRVKAKKLTWANVLIAMLDNNSIRFFDDR